MSELLIRVMVGEIKKRKLKILVAEDDYISRRLISILLNKYINCELTLVENGTHAYESACKKEFDLIFLDHHMPICNGPQASRKIRSNKTIEHQPYIVGLSASFGTDRKEFEDAGINQFISKPIMPAQLKELLSNLKTNNDNLVESY